MYRLERLARILLAAERSSEKGASIIDLFAENGTDLVGRVAAERGRICWAVARIQTLRVSDIFAEEMKISREALDEIFDTAKLNGRPFGEELVLRGLAEEEQLRSCLQRQMVAALTALCEVWAGDDDQSLRAEDALKQTYDASFTALPMDLLFACLEAAPSLREEAQTPSSTYTDLAAQMRAAVCFRGTSSPELPMIPIAASKTGEMAFAAALSLGRETLAVVRPAALRAASIDPFAVLAHRGGEGVVCAAEEPHFYVFEVGERSEYGALLSHLSATVRARV